LLDLMDHTLHFVGPQLLSIDWLEQSRQLPSVVHTDSTLT
jgi:hypothetical protein